VKHIGVALSVFCLALSPDGALASKSKTNCKQDECVKETKLSPWESHEFRGTCDNGRFPKSQYCAPAGPNVTCTISVKWNGDSNYWTCSCTNWSTVAKHKATATINCKNRY
jgi:hypothetical protein